MEKAQETNEERRLFERFSARFPVKFKDARDDYGSEVFLRDASAQGMRILTKERFFLDDQLSLEVELPDGGDPMILDGRVVWVKFLDISSSLWDLGIQFPQVDFLKMQRLFKLSENITL
jgi:Tfp pilus assembly protein PilZ